MSRDGSHDALESALRELPGMRPSEGFTDEVLARLEERDSASARRAVSPALAWTAGAAALLGATLLATLLPPAGPPRSDPPVTARAVPPAERGRAARLREEHRQLREELRAMRAVVDEYPPVVYLGGDDRVDLVFDFLPAAGVGPGRVRPAVAGSSADDRR